MKVSVKVIVVLVVIGVLAAAGIIAQRTSSSGPRSSNLSAADMELLIPEILRPEAQAQIAKPEQRKELVSQFRQILAIAQVAEREGYEKRADVKSQMELMADSSLARSYATRNPDKTVTDEEVKAYVASHAAEIDGYLEANPKLKSQIEGAQLDSFKETYARIRLMAAKARETGATDEKTADVLEFWSARQVLYQAYVEDMIAKYYEEHKNEYEQVRARHILISTSPQEEPPPQAAGQDKDAADKKPKALSKDEARKKAESILARVRKGEDFAKLAGEFSDDGSKETGGDLDYFSRGRMVPQFEQAAFSLKPGQVSDLVETQYGFHIIKVEDRRVAPQDDPDTQQAILAKLQPEIEKLAESSNVKVAEDFNFTPKAAPPRRGMPGGVPNPHAAPPPQ